MDYMEKIRKGMEGLRSDFVEAVCLELSCISNNGRRRFYNRLKNGRGKPVSKDDELYRVYLVMCDNLHFYGERTEIDIRQYIPRPKVKYWA